MTVELQTKLREPLDNHGFVGPLEVGFVFPTLTSKEKVRLNQTFHQSVLAVFAKLPATTNFTLPYPTTTDPTFTQWGLLLWR